ncbi:MAG: flippase [Planctomycetota bacterium]
MAIREVAARGRSEAPKYISAVTSIRVSMSLITYILVIIVALVIPKPVTEKMLIIIYGLSLLPIAFSFTWLFVAREELHANMIATIGGQVIHLALVLIFISAPCDLNKIPWIWLALNGITSLILVVMEISKYGVFRFSIDWQLWKSLFKESLPMAAAGFLWLPFHSIDIFLLSYVKGDIEVGWYSSARKLVFYALTGGVAFSMAIFPILSQKFKEGVSRAKSLIEQSVRLVFAFGLPVGIGGVILSKPIQLFLYGAEYEQGHYAMQFLIWVVLFIIMYYLGQVAVTAAGKQRYYLYAVALGMSVSIVLDFALVFRFGYIGVSIGTLAGEATVGIYLLLRLKQIVNFKLISPFVRPLAASVIMGIFLLFLPQWHVLILIALGALVYFIFLVVFGGVNKEDWLLVKNQIFKK